MFPGLTDPRRAGLCEHFKDAYEAIAFRAPWTMDLHGIVSLAARQPLPLGPLARLDKVKNMAHPAIDRAMLIALSKQAAASRK